MMAGSRTTGRKKIDPVRFSNHKIPIPLLFPFVPSSNGFHFTLPLFPISPITNQHISARVTNSPTTYCKGPSRSFKALKDSLRTGASVRPPAQPNSPTAQSSNSLAASQPHSLNRLIIDHPQWLPVLHPYFCHRHCQLREESVDSLLWADDLLHRDYHLSRCITPFVALRFTLQLLHGRLLLALLEPVIQCDTRPSKHSTSGDCKPCQHNPIVSHPTLPQARPSRGKPLALDRLIQSSTVTPHSASCFISRLAAE